MFQFTPYQPFYAYNTFSQSIYDYNIAADVSLSPYFYYVQKPTENVQHHILQNANDFTIKHHQLTVKGEQESKSHDNMTFTQEKGSGKRKQSILIQNGNENISHKQDGNKQKFGRNIVSNIFHLMIKFVKRQKKLRKLIEKLIVANSMTLKLNQFYQILKKKSAKLGAYATYQQMKDFWHGASFDQTNKNFVKQQECSKIFRIVGRQYLENYHIPYVYNSNKIKKQSKKLHKSAIRKIYEL